MGVERRVQIAACVVAASLFFADMAAVLAQSGGSPSLLPFETHAFLTDHPALQASLDRLNSGSTAWQDAVAAVAKTGRRALIVTPDRIRVADLEGTPSKPFDERLLAEAEPVADENQRVETVVVIVNLALLEKVHGKRSSGSAFDADLDRILAHEVYGHAVPYLLAGHLSGKCADSRKGQPAWQSCAIRRENEVRRQLGLGLRIDDGLDSLAMGYTRN